MEQTQRKGFSGFPLYATVELIYWLGYAATAFLSSYLAEEGLSSSLVGLIMGIASCVGVISCPILGNWSDKMGSPRKGLLVCAAAAAVAMVLVPVGVRTVVIGISMVIPLYWIAAAFYRPMTGLCDSWFLGVIDREGGFTFGSIRYIGSFGYAVMSIVYSWAAKQYGSSDIIFYLYAALNVGLIALCLYAGKFETAPIHRAKTKKVGIRALLGNYHLLVYLICHCLLNLPMYCSVTFTPYKLIEVTGATANLGGVTAVRSLAEIPTLILMVHYIRKVGVRKSIITVIACFAAVQLLFIGAQGMGMIYLAMLIIGMVNGGFMATQMRYIHAIVPAEAVASAVTLCTSMALISSFVGNLVGGVLVDRFGTWAYFVFAMASEVLALLIFTLSVPLGKKLGHPLPDLSEE